MTSEKRAQKFHTDDALLPRFVWCFWLAEATFTRGTTNQKHYHPDLGSDASSVWNFCARFSDVISWGNQWWSRGLSCDKDLHSGNIVTRKARVVCERRRGSEGRREREAMGYLPLTYRKPEIPVGKSNGSQHSENMGCDLRRCNFSTFFSRFSKFGYV